MITAKRVYEVFGITQDYHRVPGDNIIRHGIKYSDIKHHYNLNEMNIIDASPELLVALVSTVMQIEWAAEVQGSIGHIEDVYLMMIKAIESADSKNRPWSELLKELTK